MLLSFFFFLQAGRKSFPNAQGIAHVVNNSMKTVFTEHQNSASEAAGS